uniref:Microfibril associated protein 5 n=1 Tax=Amphiprion percula TaxID=161767 RepID=A0A3P8SNS8_AMPPE
MTETLSLTLFSVISDCREEMYPCTRMYSVHRPIKRCIGALCLYSLPRVYVINNEICVRTVCQQDEYLKVYRRRRRRNGPPHFGETESKSPQRSELEVEVGLDGATELELLESRSSKQPGQGTGKKDSSKNMRTSASIYPFIHHLNTA